MRGITALLIFLVLGVVGCSQNSGSEAVIRVRLVGEDSALDRHDLMAAQEIMRSFRTIEPVVQQFQLAEKWGVSEVSAMKRLHKSIRVRTGVEPELLAVQLKGMESELAPAILNALCQKAVTDKHVIESRTADAPEVKRRELNIEIVQQAK